MLRRLPRSRVTRALLAPLVLAAAVLVGFGVSAAGGGAGASPANSLGVYVGYQSPSGVNAFGRDVGEKPSFAMDFLDGDSWSGMVNQAASYMAAWKNSGLTMIWGVPMLPYNSSGTSVGSSGSGYSLQQGATGAYNSYFLQLAKDMVAGGEADSIIRIGWEFNGGWFPWAANGQAAAFIAYWQQIVDTMRSVPGQQFTFEWNPNLGDSGVGTLADYYPGNAYVDYIGLDVYDQAWGYYGAPGCSGTTCQQDQFNTILTEPGGLNWLASFASQQDKPIVLPEWGLGAFNPTNLNGTYQNEELGGGDDPTFINDMTNWMNAHNVFEATYWDFQQDSTSAAPASAAALLERPQWGFVGVIRLDLLGHGGRDRHCRRDGHRGRDLELERSLLLLHCNRSSRRVAKSIRRSPSRVRVLRSRPPGAPGSPPSSPRRWRRG